MLRKGLLVFSLLFIYYSQGKGQGCTTLGQTPQTAFPVCGLDTFKQATVPQCVNNSVPANICGAYPDTNPFWYKFTCYSSGTLGFLLIPNNLNDDYDWELFDITGHDPGEVYTNPALFIVANWSGNSSLESSRGYTGLTGATTTGQNNIECASNPQELGGNPPFSDAPTFSSMPVITVGHDYLLLISHFTQTQSGYSLTFNGGTAGIVDPLKPALASARTNCTGETITITLNKKVKCSSLAPDGSDFTLSLSSANVTAAGSISCNSSFDMDSFTVTLNKPLPPGDYLVIIHNGKDGNTLLDNCDNDIPPNSSIPLKVFPFAPTPMDSIIPVQCAPDLINLVFRNRIRCSSVASNGSDFKVTGNAPVTVVSADGDSCANGLSYIIKVKLSKPIQNAGNFNIILQKGTDGNTLLDECAQEMPPGSSLSFITADTVSAFFNYRVGFGCIYDTFFYAHDGRNGVNEWNWVFDSSGTAAVQDSFFVFKDYGAKHIQLTTSNGVCTDSAATDILLDNQLISRFQVLPSKQLCPEDGGIFVDSSIGKIISWNWIFGDGTISTDQNPPPKYYPFPSNRSGTTYPVALIVKNNIGCFDTSETMMKIFYSCYIAVPSAFTPNGDGLNDYLYPLYAYKADNLEFSVYNRWGQLVFKTKDWTKKWDGKINGNPQAAGTYVWMLRYTNHDTGKLFSLKGTTVLIR